MAVYIKVSKDDVTLEEVRQVFENPTDKFNIHNFDGTKGDYYEMEVRGFHEGEERKAKKELLKIVDILRKQNLQINIGQQFYFKDYDETLEVYSIREQTEPKIYLRGTDFDREVTLYKSDIVRLLNEERLKTEKSLNTSLLNGFISDLAWGKDTEMDRLKQVYLSFSPQEREFVEKNAVREGANSIEEVFEKILSKDEKKNLENKINNFFNTVKQNGGLLRLASEELRNDKDVAIEAYLKVNPDLKPMKLSEQDTIALEYYQNSLKNSMAMDVDLEKTGLSFKDKYITPLSKEYKDFIKEYDRENMPYEMWKQDGERTFSAKEQKFLDIYAWKNGILTKSQSDNLEKIVDIAGKTQTDKNYLSLFNEKTQKAVQDFLRSHPNMDKIALTPEDKIALSERLGQDIDLIKNSIGKEPVLSPQMERDVNQDVNKFKNNIEMNTNNQKQNEKAEKEVQNYLVNSVKTGNEKIELSNFKNVVDHLKNERVFDKDISAIEEIRNTYNIAGQSTESVLEKIQNLKEQINQELLADNHETINVLKSDIERYQTLLDNREKGLPERREVATFEDVPLAAVEEKVENFVKEKIQEWGLESDFEKLKELQLEVFFKDINKDKEVNKEVNIDEFKENLINKINNAQAPKQEQTQKTHDEVLNLIDDILRSDKVHTAEELVNRYNSLNEHQKDYFQKEGVREAISQIEELIEEVLPKGEKEKIENKINNFLSTVKQMEQLKEISNQKNIATMEANVQAEKILRDWEIKEGTPLHTNDVYAFFKQGGKSSLEIFNKEIGAILSEDKQLKSYPTRPQLLEVVNQIRQLPQEQQVALKERMNSYLKIRKEQSVEKAKEFLNGYEIRPEVALTHRDIYAFLNQAGKKSKEHLKEAIEKCLGQEITLPQSISREEAIQNIVKPIREKGEEAQQSFKKELAEKVQLAQQEVQQETSEKKKYKIEEIQSFYLGYEIRPELPLIHQDIYAFVCQMKDGGMERVTDKVKELTGLENQLSNTPKKNEVLSKIVYPIKEAGKEQEFKESLNTMLIANIQVEAQEVKVQEIEKHIRGLEDIQYPSNGEKFTKEHVEKMMVDLWNNGSLVSNLYKTELSRQSMDFLEKVIESPSIESIVGNPAFLKQTQKIQEELQDHNISEQVLKSISQSNGIKHRM